MDDEIKDILSSGKRDKDEIIAAIIAVAQERIKSTDLRNQTNLCFSTLGKYLKLMARTSLIERKKIKEDSGRTVLIYQATQKGLNFLEVYCELINLICGNNFVENKNNVFESRACDSCGNLANFCCPKCRICLCYKCNITLTLKGLKKIDSCPQCSEKLS